MRPFLLGLTGSIGMGKSTAAKIFRRLGVPVHESDPVVHRLLVKGGRGVPIVAEAFPGVVADGQVDRTRLGGIVFADPERLVELEGLLHPLVTESRERFIKRHARNQTALVVLDIPLLFETGAEREVDAVLVVSAPEFVQRQRVLARPGMTPERFAAIAARQLPDAEKRRRADYVVETGLSKHYTLRQIARLVRTLRPGA
ncbi:MAG: dephospho-CoA kinase [Alphaproteobacteria bacterium]